jgi:hypothetical protein
VTDTATVQMVVRYLGRCAGALILGVVALAGLLIFRQVEPSAAVVGLLTSLSTLTGTAVGALGSMLVSTRSTPEAGSTPVIVAPASSGLEQVAAPPGPVVPEG